MEDGTVSASVLFVCLVLTALAQDDVRMPPNIIYPLVPAKEYYSNGTNLTLTCNATGNPKPTYKWYRNGVEVSNLDGISYNTTTGVLEIKPLTVDREGVFQCRAKNTFPERMQPVAVSAKIEALVVRVWERPDGTEKSFRVTKTLDEGEYTFIRCGDPLREHVGKISFRWMYKIDSNHTLSQNERIFVDSEGTIHFAYVLRSDQLASNGAYYCDRVSVRWGKIWSSPKRTILVVRRKSPVTERPPVLRFSTRSLGPLWLTFKRNSEARLECFFSGYVNSYDNEEKVSNITWRDDAGNRIISGRGRYKIENYGRVLRIENLVEPDEKTYTCTGVNKIGRAEGAMKLNITSAPIWVKPLVTTTVVQGENAQLYCQSKSAVLENPPNKPNWMMNGQPFRVYDPKKYVFTDQKQMLTVMSVRKSKDITCFQCYVSNSVGEEFGNGCLNVILPIRITTRPKSVQAVGRGDTVNLTVAAVSDRLFPVSYRWIFKEKTYEGDQAPPHVLYNISSGFAYINTTNFTDEEMVSLRGVYRREVFHRVQKVVVNVEVRVGSEYDRNDNELKYSPLKLGIGLALGFLVVIILVVIFHYIRRRNRPDVAVGKRKKPLGQTSNRKLARSRSSILSQTNLHPSRTSVARSGVIKQDYASYAIEDDYTSVGASRTDFSSVLTSEATTEAMTSQSEV